MIQLKIKESNNLVKHISLIRKYNTNLSIAYIKSKIENQEYVIEHDLHQWDICDDIADIDRNVLFRELISSLLLHGALIELFENDEPISIEHFDNILVSLKETELETLLDMDREAED